MTPVAIFMTARQYGRCPAFWRAAVQLGLLRAVKLNPVEVMDEEFAKFAAGLTPEVIRQVNAHMEKKRPRKGTSPASPDHRKPGPKPGSGYVSKFREDAETADTFPGSGGTRAGDPSGGVA